MRQEILARRLRDPNLTAEQRTRQEQHLAAVIQEDNQRRGIQ